jgi:hypothetical protein
MAVSMRCVNGAYNPQWQVPGRDFKEDTKRALLALEIRDTILIISHVWPVAGTVTTLKRNAIIFTL